MKESSDSLKGLFSNLVSTLIDSPGGYEIKAKRMDSLLREVIEEGGEVYTFGSNEVASAGARLFMVPQKDRRFMHPSSEFMMHISNTATIEHEKAEDDPNMKKSIAQDRERELREISDILLKDVRERYRAILSDVIKKSQSDPKNNPDHAIHLSGENLIELGLTRPIGDIFDRFIEVNSLETLEGMSLTDDIAEFLTPSYPKLDAFEFLFGENNK